MFIPNSSPIKTNYTKRYTTDTRNKLEKIIKKENKMNYIEILYINPLNGKEYAYRIKEKDMVEHIHDEYDGGINHPIKITSAHYVVDGEVY